MNSLSVAQHSLASKEKRRAPDKSRKLLIGFYVSSLSSFTVRNFVSVWKELIFICNLVYSGNHPLPTCKCSKKGAFSRTAYLSQIRIYAIRRENISARNPLLSISLLCALVVEQILLSLIFIGFSFDAAGY